MSSALWVHTEALAVKGAVTDAGLTSARTPVVRCFREPGPGFGVKITKFRLKLLDKSSVSALSVEIYFNNKLFLDVCISVKNAVCTINL